MSTELNNAPQGLDKGSFVALDAVEFSTAYATFVQGVAGKLPRDPDFPTEYQDARSGEVKPLPDTPLTRATYAASNRFTDEDRRLSFMCRLQLVMPIAMSGEYAQYRNDDAGTMHLALLAAVAAMPFNVHHTPKDLRAMFDQSFRNSLAALKPFEEEGADALEDTMH